MNAPVLSASADALQQIRVMVVDDSTVIRGIISRWIEANTELKVVASAFNGQAALDLVVSSKPDVILLDVEMPGMDGITALPQLVKAAPNAKILMSSTLTRRNAEITIKALSLGATDYVAKPTALKSGDAAEDFRRELIEKVLVLGRASRPRSARPAAGVLPIQPSTLRRASPVPPQIIAIGASTGGPQALAEVIVALAPGLKVPVVITQHMPATFTSILAAHLARISGLKCEEGRTGAMLAPGLIHIAPGDHHMLVKGHGGPIELTRTPPENFCRPAVDPMFRSVAAAYGSATLAIVLTGMGSDGCEGARTIAMAGGTVLAQDEATSVVWGMPGAVAKAGLCSAILPLDRIGSEARKFLGTSAR